MRRERRKHFAGDEETLKATPAPSLTVERQSEAFVSAVAFRIGQTRSAEFEGCADVPEQR